MRVIQLPPKVSKQQYEVTVDADAAAAIHKAATSGIKNPSLELFLKLSGVGIGQGPGNVGGQSLSFRSLHTSQPPSSIQRQTAIGQPSVSVPVAKAIAEMAALAAANEGDSS
ncbi:hypothetical protein L484_004512 [Morus notabilis]|uniref:Uncharacterized protein n=1 Tax=Morus notabilis TaxID=981085 RepID=W9QS01_9ROSA|nr:hypothetical protein L484_004512 [Morus notabilis]